MARSRCPKGPELLAYQDAALGPRRQAEVDAHVRECPACRDYLWESDEIGRLLRRHVPIVDDPKGLARLKARLAAEPPTEPPASRTRDRRWPLAASLALLTVLGLSLLSAGTIEGGSSFTRWLSRESESSEGRILPGGYFNVTPATLPTVGQDASLLPFGLVATGMDWAPDGSGQTYRNVDGLAILVVTDSSPSSAIVIPDDPSATLIVEAGGRDVLLTFAETEVSRSVVEIDWIVDDVRHAVLVLDQPAGGLTIEMARVIADALITGGLPGSEP